MRHWMLLAKLPINVFGLLTGLTIQATGRKRADLTVTAEFDATLQPTLDAAKRSDRLAWAQKIGLYAAIALGLTWVSK